MQIMKQVSSNKNSLVLTPRYHPIFQQSLFLRYSFGFLFALMVILAGGCKKGDNHFKKAVPLHAEFTTVSTMLQEGPPELDLIKGDGNGTPIGKSTFVANAQFDENFDLTGTITLTAETGNKFFASITGHAPDVNEKTGDVTLHFQATITGGTGVFTGATGSFDGVAHESIYTPDGTATWDGTITF